ncbi:MAG TPA: diguanylate cyclase [Gaiellaceae bacterium]|jgi:diguanylate cyclase (GGDEF)-like protein
MFADGSATWTSAAALGLASLFLALGLLLFWRWRRATAQELAEVHDSTVRTARLIGEVRAALADAQKEGRRAALMGDLGATLDLDAALRRALEAVSELTGADAAMIVLRHDGDEPVAATFGLSDEESARQLIGLSQDAGDARAVRLGYLYTPEEVANDEFRLTGGLAVPLVGEDGGRIGTLAIFWRRVERMLSDSDLEKFEELSRVFGPALENARLFSEARRLADTDYVTRLHNARYLEERLRREVARAQRYERRLGLLVFDVEDGEQADLATAGHRIRAAVRSTDVASHLGEGRFAIILPEAGEADTERLHRRLQFALGGRVDSADGFRVQAGLAELRPDEDAVALWLRAGSALERTKQAAAERLTAAQ